MNENIELRKYGADKIAFLGMFVIALLIAHFMASANSALNFSKPIELNHTGLSLSIPAGKGWQSTQKWKYENNVFVLSSNLITRSGSIPGQLRRVPDAAVNCRYSLTSQKLAPKMLFGQQNDDPNTIIKTGVIQKGNLTIQTACIEKPVLVFWGAAELPNNRTVTIEVFQTTFEIEVAERIFTKIIESLNFNEDNPVQTGTEFVTQIQNDGLDTLLNEGNQQGCFFIHDAGNRNIGFTIDLLGKLNSSEQPVIKGASQLFLEGRESQEQISLFQADKNLSTYTWQSRITTRTGSADIKIVLDKSGIIYVANQLDENNYPNGSKVVPGIFLELLISRIAQNKITEAVIDIIDAGGRISPVLFSFESENENNGEYSRAVTVEFLDGRGRSELFYLNDDNRILKSAGRYNLERTGIDSIEKEFPGQANFILQQIQQLNNEAL